MPEKRSEIVKIQESTIKVGDTVRVKKYGVNPYTAIVDAVHLNHFWVSSFNGLLWSMELHKDCRKIPKQPQYIDITVTIED